MRKYNIGSWANHEGFAKTFVWIRKLSSSLHHLPWLLESFLPNVGLADWTLNKQQRRKNVTRRQTASLADDSNDYYVRNHDPHNSLMNHANDLWLLWICDLTFLLPLYLFMCPGTASSSNRFISSIVVYITSQTMPSDALILLHFRRTSRQPFICGFFSYFLQQWFRLSEFSVFSWSSLVGTRPRVRSLFEKCYKKFTKHFRSHQNH